MPTSIRQRFLDLLAIGRVSNLPTVWSNVFVGILLGLTVPSLFVPATSVRLDLAWSPHIQLAEVILACFAATCAYLFGTFLNDWKDVDFDRLHRPERAVPSNRLRRNTLLAVAIVLGATSLAAFASLSWSVFATGALLLALIVTYTWIHKRTPLAIIPMGLCRACLYLIGFLAATTGLAWNVVWGALTKPAGIMAGSHQPVTVLLALLAAAAGLALYIAGLTLAARSESRPDGLRTPKVIFWFLLFLPFLTHTWWWIFRRPPFLEGLNLAIPALIGLLPFLLWTVRALFVLRKNIGDFVARTLAGICLVDLLLYPGIAASIHGTDSHLINTYPLLLALVPLALFLFALVLQRIAPAT